MILPDGSDSTTLQSLEHIGKAWGFPLHSIGFLVRACGLKPHAMKGNIKLYTPAQVKIIRAKLEQIAAEQAYARDAAPIVLVEQAL